MLPFPGRRDLWLLAAGLLLGVLLGPPVLGSASPAAYRALFGGTEAFAQAEEARDQAVEARGRAAAQLGLAGEAGEAGEAGAGPQGEARERAEANLAQLDAMLTRGVNARYQAVGAAMDSRAVRWLLALLVALVGVAVAEALVSPDPAAARARAGADPSGSASLSAGPAEDRLVVSPVTRRLVTIRYALLAAAIAVVLARATLYEGIPWVFALALLAVAAAAAWVPLPRRASAPAGSGGSAASGAVEPAADRADGAAG